jgi:hypothetical protein
MKIKHMYWAAKEGKEQSGEEGCAWRLLPSPTPADHRSLLADFTQALSWI